MRRTTRRIALCFCLMFSLAVLSNIVQAQTITVLHNFTGGADGGYPAAGLTMDAAGNLYSTAYGGGPSNAGVVFRLSRAGSVWILTPLYSFHGVDGANPFSGVVFGPDGSLYGTTYNGGQYGQGTVFRLQPSPEACHSVICPWEETVLYSFSGGDDGGNPVYGNPVFDQAGNIYGTTLLGGSGGYGVVFELMPSNGSWTESVLWNFMVEGGVYPQSGLIFDRSGNLYGTTSKGGTFGEDAGVVYELSPSGSGWNEVVLSLIAFPHTNTCSGVVMDGQGDLFGASGCEGAGFPGGVFELTPSNGSWTFNVLHTFSGGSGSYGPSDSPTLDAAGNVYGTSSETGLNNEGEVFKLMLLNGGWIYSSASFDGSNGEFPSGSVILDAAGNIYGTAGSGGANGAGTVWEITP